MAAGYHGGVKYGFEFTSSFDILYIPHRENGFITEDDTHRTIREVRKLTKIWLARYPSPYCKVVVIRYLL